MRFRVEFGVVLGVAWISGGGTNVALGFFEVVIEEMEESFFGDGALFAFEALEEGGRLCL